MSKHDECKVNIRERNIKERNIKERKGTLNLGSTSPRLNDAKSPRSEYPYQAAVPG